MPFPGGSSSVSRSDPALGLGARYAALRGKGSSARPLPLGPWRGPALGAVVLWLGLAIGLPLSGIFLRSVVSAWGEGVQLSEVLTLDNFRELVEFPNVVRGVVNTLALGVVGGALAVACYAGIGLAAHRWQSRFAQALDYLVMVPRGMPELEEAALTMGASPGQVIRHVTLPLVRFGLLGSWLLVFSIFVREYSTGVYLLGPGTEVIGSLIVSLWGSGALDQIAALSAINVVLVAAGLAVALRLGVRLHG